MSIKNFDMRVINRYLSSQASDDLNRFLEQMPTNVGKTALIAGGVAWAISAVLGLNMFMQSKQLTELRGQLETAEAVKPLVPIIKANPVDAAELKAWTEEAQKAYPGLTISANANTVSIMSKDTAAYAQFRESIGHVLNGGQNWKASVESFCLGRECQQNALEAILKMEKLTIDKPSS